MSVKDRETLAALFRAQGLAPPSQSWEEQRAGIEALGAMLPPVEGFEAMPATVGGIKGEWVRGKHVRRNDAAVLYLHGGGYAIGSPKSHRHLVGQLSIDSGLPVFCADYRLAPEYPFPAAVEDGVAAYKGLLDGGIVPANLAIAGDSAGGGLAMATLLMARDPIVTREGIDVMAAAYLGSADAKNPLASPVFADLKGLPPLLIQVGSEEALHSDAATLAQRAEAAGVEVSFESWGGMIHVWHAFHPILSEGRDAIARIGAYLKQRIA